MTSDAIEEAPHRPPESHSPGRSKFTASRNPRLQSLDRLASASEINKIQKSPKVKRARTEYHAKKLSINLYRMVILLQQQK